LGIVSIVFLAGCGGGTSRPVGQPVDNQPPPPTPTITTPTITSIWPTSVVAGDGDFTLTIDGTNFVAGSTVNFGGAAPATTFVATMQVTAAIPASSITSTGTVAVTVTNPAPGGGTSTAVNFAITNGMNPVPMISFLSPSCVPVGEQLAQLGVVGLNFMAGSVVRWNGTNRPTTLDNNSQGQILTAQLLASDIAVAGTAAVTVLNPPPGGGSSNSVTFATTPGGVDPQSVAVDPTGKFAYVATTGCGAGGYVSMYTINPATGALTFIGPPVPTDDEGTDSVTVDPFGKFAYVASSGLFDTDGSVDVYTIDATTGALTYTGAVNGDGPDFCCFNSVAVHPSGKFAYVVDGIGGSDSVSMYSINATTGALTSIGQIGAGTFPVSVAVDPSGKFAYVADASDAPGSAGNVSMYTIDATTGALASIGTIAAGTDPVSVVVDPSGKFAYLTDSDSNAVWMYTINATTGALASIGTIAAGTDPVSLAVDPSGKFAYVTNYNSNDVSMYSIDGATGALTPIGTIATGPYPTSIAVHPSGKFAYVTNSGSDGVSMYSIDTTTGVLTLIGTIGS
jgi:6-phosphogluconolactonase (cycloisomerase 2 family)